MKKKSFEELVELNESDTPEIMQITFKKDGWGIYTDQVRDKKKTAKRFLGLCAIVINNPEMVYHGFELCKENRGVNKKNWIKEAIREIGKHGRRY